MTVEETFRFAFDSMNGGTHGLSLAEGQEGFSDDQKDLVSWMDSKYFKVAAAVDVSLVIGSHCTVAWWMKTRPHKLECKHEERRFETGKQHSTHSV